MATLKQRLCKRNNKGTYDTVHLETSADVVLMSNGATVGFLAHFVIPQLLAHLHS